MMLMATTPAKGGASVAWAFSTQGYRLNALFTSTGIVALAEMGDKTQLLAFLLAARFRRPLPIILGILAATLLNHGIAGAFGAWIATVLTPVVLRWGVGLLFLAMAAWTLIPDKIEDEETRTAVRLGVFGATFVTFFLAEMGDKTQIATVAMATQFSSVVLVIAGTTLGMLIADVPAVFLGQRFAERIPMKLVPGIPDSVVSALVMANLDGLGEAS